MPGDCTAARMASKVTSDPDGRQVYFPNARAIPGIVAAGMGRKVGRKLGWKEGVFGM